MNKKSVEKTKSQKNEAQYERQIRSLETEVRRLKGELRTAQDMLEKTNDFVIEMTKDRSVEDILKDVKKFTDAPVEDKCPNCSTNEMKKIDLGTMTIIVCTRCSYRNRLHARNQSSETT